MGKLKKTLRLGGDLSMGFIPGTGKLLKKIMPKEAKQYLQEKFEKIGMKEPISNEHSDKYKAAKDRAERLKRASLAVPDDEALRRARRRSAATQQSRSGRTSTILSDEPLGG